jgi:hypothetical protein
MPKFIVAVGTPGAPRGEFVEADYWIERGGMLLFLNKARGQQYDQRIAAYAPGHWLSVKE